MLHNNEYSCINKEDKKLEKAINKAIKSKDSEFEKQTAALKASINTEKEWLCTMAESFHFPVFLKKEKKIINWFEGAYFNSLNCSINWEEFEDWMTDLSWINEPSVALILLNYDRLLINNIEAKSYIYNNLKNVILPWWDTGVTQYMVGGKTRQINVFLIR